MLQQSDIRNATDVVRYLREYAIRSNGNQPLAIGITPEAWTEITKEMAEPFGVRILKICDVVIVAVP